MKFHCSALVRRGGAAALALTLLTGLCPAALADEAQLPPTHDETYYATLDYYGGVMDSSVVKSYQTFGASSITDYGVYQEVTNLTDDREATLGEDSVTFQLGEDAPNRFYFEGKTTKPLEEFPWTLSLSYSLNGVPAKAEELAGQQGVVDITLNALPNPNASEYSRNNLILTAVSMFNGDDILSLQAPGAQVQMIGNLYCVLYMVLPGEEQHFTLSVGSNAFTYSGMIFLAMPATLDQLDKIADLKEAKEKTEDSYNAIQDSLDVILNTLEGMSGSFNTAANGLDELDKARDTVSAGKQKVYDSLDIALDAAGPLAESLQPMEEHLTTAQQALTDTTALLNEMSANLTSLKPEVENARDILERLQKDTKELRELLDELESYPSRAKRTAKYLAEDFSSLGSSLGSLEKTLKSLRTQISSLDSQISGLEGGNKNYITINGKTVEEIERLVSQANQLRAAYEASEYVDVISFQDFITSYLMESTGAGPEEAAAQAAALAQLWVQAQTSEFEEQLSQAKQINQLLKEFDLTVSQLKSLVGAVNDGASPILKQLESLCNSLGSGKLSGDLEDLSKLMEDMMKDLDEHSGALSSTLSSLDRAGDLAIRVSENVDTALDQVQSLTDLMNTYEPQAQQALEDAKTFASSASTSITALVDAAKAAENLAKESGPHLNAGTKQALEGLSSALRESAKGLGQTSTIRNAKDTIDALIRDEWDSHTGEGDNLLLMDASAQPISLTDSRNENTTSIQYVMRTQEIQEEDPPAQEFPAADQGDNGTLWTRIADMFRDIWNTITGWFH
ncbi:hypothetical protein [Flavonifractor sp. An100]|uniref:hypothetical protein n=1 Tax=Flavonifractor sp. An100 TaxID=1965538 RepID=UPI000B38CBDB|nr:hypothetical protein [Flavonifractor sp. An100]OUQ79459.1 hypothetical protein B5E43_05785 [Flavonifractor sp. An100]